MTVENHFISKDDLLTLLFHMEDDKISLQSLSMWVKSQTAEQFVVVPREFCALMVAFLEKQATQKESLLFNSEKVFSQIEEIKSYL